MASNNALTLLGSTPNQTSTPQFASNALTPRNAYGTPVSNALNKVSTPSTFGFQTSAPSASTPLKATKTTNVDGSTVEHSYHAPATDTKSSTSSAPTDKLPGLLSQADTVKSQIDQAQGMGYGQNDQIQKDAQGNVVSKNSTFPGLVSSLADRSSKPTDQYTSLTQQAEQAYKDAADTNTIINRSKQLALQNPNYTLSAAQGRAGLIDQNYGQIGLNATNRAAGLATLANTENTQQGLQQSGLTSAANLAQPQSYGLTSQPYNPLSDTYGGGGSNGAVNRGVQAGNISSAQELTSQKNQLQSTFNGVEANYDLLVNTARQGGVNDGNVPALNALQQNVARGLASNEAVINFRNTLSAVRAGYAQILGGGTATVDSQHRAEEAIPENISLNALVSLGEQLKSEAGNRIAGIDQQVNSISGNSSQNFSTGGIVKTTAGNISTNW